MTAFDWHDITRAAAIIRQGGLVAMPTETVYGLAADATNDSAVARIFEAKGRPSFNPLIVHILDVEAATRFAEISPLARRLADAFWPGPLTLVLPRKAGSPISLLVSAGLDTTALRAPSAPIARALIEASGRPLAAPSANRSGGVSPTRAEHVRESLGDAVDMVLDGGACAVGVESTIVKVGAEGASLLRPGGVTKEEIELALGRPLLRATGAAVEAPGMLASHYAPGARLRITVSEPAPDEAYLAFGPTEPRPNALNLSDSSDLREAAANLFAHLRALDRIVAEKGLAGIAAAPVPETGLGAAINDRLRRAAAPRR